MIFDLGSKLCTATCPSDSRTRSRGYAVLSGTSSSEGLFAKKRTIKRTVILLVFSCEFLRRHTLSAREPFGVVFQWQFCRGSERRRNDFIRKKNELVEGPRWFGELSAQLERIDASIFFIPPGIKFFQMKLKSGIDFHTVLWESFRQPESSNFILEKQIASIYVWAEKLYQEQSLQKLIKVQKYSRPTYFFTTNFFTFGR